MKNTRPTTERIKTHFTYTWWAYLLSALFLLILWDMAYGWTEYRAPAERSVYVNYAGAYVSEDARIAVEEELRAAFPVEEIEYIQVDAFTIDYADTEHLSASVEKLMAMIGTGEGDLYLLHSANFQQYAQMGAFTPLDTYLAPGGSLEGLFTPEQIALGTYTTEENGTHCYGLPCDTFYAYYDLGIDPSNYMIAMMSISSNPEGTYKVFEHMIHSGMDAERPAFLDEAAQSDQIIQDEAAQIAPIG